MRNLTTDKIADRRIRVNPDRLGRIFEYRMMTGRRQAIGDFLTIIARFAVLDEGFIAEGRNHAADILDDKGGLRFRR